MESYAKVKYESVYPGIDLIYYGNDEGQIEYDFKVAPGADPSRIAMSVEGADRVETDGSGALILTTTVGRLRQHAPRIYQEDNGTQQEIAGRYRLLKPASSIESPKSEIQNPVVSFTLGDYDASRELVIDPELVYAAYLGGAAGDFDGGYGITVDAAGNAYVTGTTGSTDFPTRNPLDGTGPDLAASKAFVTKFGPDGSLIYSTYLGGGGGGTGVGRGATGTAIAVDSSGAAYIADFTNYGDFPTKNAFQPAAGDNVGPYDGDAFVAKLSPDGASLVYSTYLGGNREDSATDIKVDSSNVAYIVGNIRANGASNVTFPTVNALQTSYGGGDSDGFLSIVSPAGNGLSFSTFIGGNRRDVIPTLTLQEAASCPSPKRAARCW